MPADVSIEGSVGIGIPSSWDRVELSLAPRYSAKQPGRWSTKRTLFALLERDPQQHRRAPDAATIRPCLSP